MTWQVLNFSASFLHILHLFRSTITMHEVDSRAQCLHYDNGKNFPSETPRSVSGSSSLGLVCSLRLWIFSILFPVDVAVNAIKHCLESNSTFPSFTECTLTHSSRESTQDQFLRQTSLRQPIQRIFEKYEFPAYYRCTRKFCKTP